jgi:hypothetical protein
MYARLMAFTCLLSVGAFAGSLDRANGSRVVIQMRHQNDVPALVTDAMRTEASAQMQKGGHRLQWAETPREVTADFLVIVTLEGHCIANLPSGLKRTLASTVVEEGRILPFVNLNCSALQTFLTTVLGAKPKPPSLVGRALGRLLAHELYHVIGQTTEHTSSGVSQPAVSVRELISEQFTFGQDALARMRLLPASADKSPECQLDDQ